MEYPLSREEALLEMRKGNKVSHSTFTENEWMTKKGGLIHFEDGAVCTPDVFWKYRQMEIFNNNYKIFNQ